MEKINFTDATITAPAKLIIEGNEYNVTEAQYDGGTDLNAETFNTMQNNIETAINDVYSLNETKTNKVWFNGKPIYRKVINFGTLPNADIKSVAHGIENVEYWTGLYGIYFKPNMSSFTCFPAIFPRNEYEIYGVALEATNQVVTVITGSDRSNYNAYIILEYTKNN